MGMATAPGSDVVPVRKETKARLAALRQGRTFDEVIRDLLEGRIAAPPPRDRPRSAQEQLALAELARRRWQLLVKSGTLVERGPRLVTWNIPKEEPRDLRVTWPARRG